MQTYFIWLWLETAYTQTFSRVPDGGNSQVGFIGSLAASSLKETITTMQLELPMFTLASQFNISYSANVTNNQMDCNGFYMNVFQWPSQQADALCADTSNTFNFVNNPTNNQGYIKTAIALTSIYLYGNKFDTANQDYYGTFMNLTGWNQIQITQQVHNPNSLVTYFMDNEIAAPVYAHY